MRRQDRREAEGEMVLRVISLGAGVQSTTMALMAAHGKIGPMPDCAIFADTGWEPKAVYEHLEWLKGGNVLPFPIHAVSNGDIRAALTSDKPGRYASVPFFLKTGDEKGMGRRQCTHEYKLKPLMWKFRELLGKKRRDRIAKGACEVWIGISTDEAMRMKPATAAWQVNRWPLIEKRMSRWDCLQWLKRNGYPQPPKSSCIGCPFHGNRHWRDMKDNSPAEWADAVQVDAPIRAGGTQFNAKIRGEQYMHSSLKPLDQVDLSTPEDHGQLNLFNNECEGMCGV
jgi:hypothetical protein